MVEFLVFWGWEGLGSGTTGFKARENETSKHDRRFIFAFGPKQNPKARTNRTAGEMKPSIHDRWCTEGLVLLAPIARRAQTYFGVSWFIWRHFNFKKCQHFYITLDSLLQHKSSDTQPFEHAEHKKWSLIEASVFEIEKTCEVELDRSQNFQLLPRSCPSSHDLSRNANKIPKDMPFSCLFSLNWTNVWQHR